jgi:hypothetical protein
MIFMNETKFINLTGSTIQFTDYDDRHLSLMEAEPGNLHPTLLYTDDTSVYPLLNSKIEVLTRNQHVRSLPDPQDGVIYIVTKDVASFAKRSDVVSPMVDRTTTYGDNGRASGMIYLGVKYFVNFA